MQFFKHPLFEKHNLGLSKQAIKPYSQKLYQQKKKLTTFTPITLFSKKSLREDGQKQMIRASKKTDRYIYGNERERKGSSGRFITDRKGSGARENMMNGSVVDVLGDQMTRGHQRSQSDAVFAENQVFNRVSIHNRVSELMRREENNIYQEMVNDQVKKFITNYFFDVNNL